MVGNKALVDVRSNTIEHVIQQILSPTKFLLATYHSLTCSFWVFVDGDGLIHFLLITVDCEISPFSCCFFLLAKKMTY